MKMKLIILVAATTLLTGANIQAKQITADEATAYMMKAFEDEGTLDNLSNDELGNFERLVKFEVTKELANYDVDQLDLSDGARDAFLLDTFKKVASTVGGIAKKGFEAVKTFGGKVISGIKGLAQRAIDVAKSLAAKIGPILQKFGPKLLAMAGKLNPKFAGAAEALQQLVPGLTQQQAAGAVAATTQGAGENKTPEEATSSALDLLNSMPVQ